MEALSNQLVFRERNPTITGSVCPHKRPVLWSFDVSIVVNLNKLWNKTANLHSNVAGYHIGFALDVFLFEGLFPTMWGYILWGSAGKGALDTLGSAGSVDSGGGATPAEATAALATEAGIKSIDSRYITVHSVSNKNDYWIMLTEKCYCYWFSLRYSQYIHRYIHHRQNYCFLWSRWRGKRSRHSRRMHNPQFYVSCKRPIVKHNGNPRIWHFDWLELTWHQPKISIVTLLKP